MLRARIVLASTLLLGAAPLAAPSHAIQCAPLTSDVCATYYFACQRLNYHGIDSKLCHLQ